MKMFRVFAIVAPLLLVCACSGGGGTTTSSVATWEKFRHDINNTGAGVAAVATPAALAIQNGHIRSVPVDSATPGPVSSSAAIALGDTIYVGSESGTLAAFDTSLNVRWRMTSCACPTPTPGSGMAPASTLGPIVSSPAVSSLTGPTSIFVGSMNGQVFGFTDNGTSPPACTACFAPPADEFGPGASVTVTFASSPTFTTDPVVLTVSSVFIGARLDVQPQGGSPRTIGKVYAINNNGTLNWEFPRQGAADIAAVTSSPALGSGNTLYFADAAGFLYALTADGTLKWKMAIGPVADSTLPFAPSPMTTANFIISPTADGSIVLITPDQLVNLRIASGDVAFSSSLAVGELSAFTPTPVESPTQPSGPSPTQTATPTAGSPSFVFGVTHSGNVLAMDVNLPTPTVFPPQTPIPAPVISSPALSPDGFLVFGSTDGHLHMVDTGTGLEPSGWPVLLVPTPGATPAAIRSSPSIGSDGTIYVGSDDGQLYAVGLP